MVANVVLLVALILTGLACFYYTDAYRRSAGGRSERSVVTPKAWFFYRLSAGAVSMAGLWLLFVIVADQFQYAYVSSYSSRDLEWFYKLSAFWAGQEGSFLLWLVFHVAFGLAIGRQEAAKPSVMAVYSVLQLLLTVLVLTKTPFSLLAELPLDGIGLNPLLQDPWMVIHPPVVFLGYAALAVPLAYAFGGLLDKDHKNWLDRALPWALFAWAALGAGIFIGGFWAYKVLGWGGYWSWDPVENSSLVPWLVAAGFIHALLLARLRPAAVKFAYLGAIFTYVLVLYGTFLTRSGILSNFSTHSFADEGIGGLLGGMVLVVSAVLLVTLAVYWQDLPRGEVYKKLQNRECIMLAGVAVIMMLAGLVFVGMSTPLITLFFGQAQSVNATFYNTTALPLTAVLMLLITIATVARWGGNELPSLKSLWWLVGAGHVALFIGIWLGIHNPVVLTGLGLAGAAAVASFRPRPLVNGNWAAALSHGGLAVMVMGIIVSSAASQSTIVSFVPGQIQELFGTKITYLGQEVTQDGKGLYHKFTVAGSENDILHAHTKFNREGKPAAREPGIRRGVAADLYVAPIMKHDQDFSKEIFLVKGEQKTEEELTLTFIRFGMRRDETQAVHVAAFLEIIRDGRPQAIQPEIISANGQYQSKPIEAHGYQFMLTSVDTAGGKVGIGIRQVDKPATKQVEVEISHKPLVNLVWLGATLITVGGLWAAWQRLKVIR